MKNGAPDPDGKNGTGLPIGYAYARKQYYDSTGAVDATYVYQQFEPWDTVSVPPSLDLPCPVGAYKICFDNTCTSGHPYNAVVDIATDYCTTNSIPAPCNWMKIQVGFPTLENELDYWPYMRAVVIDEIVPGVANVAEYYKHVDTKKFHVKIECGNSTHREQYPHTKEAERLIF